MLNILACDDDKNFLAALTVLLSENLTFPYTLKTAVTVLELEEYLRKSAHLVDVVLMDIELYRQNGVNVALQIVEQYQNIKIIFITGYIGKYYEALFLQVRPFGVLGKPVKPELLTQLLDKADKMRSPSCFLTVKIHSGIMNVDRNQIVYIESIKRDVYLHLEEQIVLCRETLAGLAKKLPDHFLLCHKSFLINMDKIRCFASNEFQMSDGARIGISKSRLKDVRERYFLYMGSRV